MTKLSNDLSITLASLGRMTMDVLKCGSCEPLKAGVHATALGLAVLMGLYNAAAWLTRRERHLGVNAVLYAGLTIWEASHVMHHSQHGVTKRSSATIPREDTSRRTRSQRSSIPTPEWVDSPLAGGSTASLEELAS